MNIIRKARGSEIPKQAQQVFLCCDVQDERDNIISDLLSMDAGIDCVVSYLENQNLDRRNEVFLRNELTKTETQLLVIFVTIEMLESIVDKKWSLEYHIAQELNIPVLFILKDDGLFRVFERKIGKIHCIDRSSSEYRIKLKEQMKMFLAPDELIKEIREKAFTSKIFLSYRRDDIKEARCFMKTFHNLNDFETVSVWYDNFLVAGRCFDNDIKESITNSEALVILATPNMLETDHNYVLKEEYPFARKIHKSIIPVEAVAIDSTKFAELFPDTENVIPLNDSITMRNVFLNKLNKSICLKQLDNERAYLLGMAYFNGIDVERDLDRAIRLLEITQKFCDEHAYNAAIQLANIYQNGLGTNINYEKALLWREKVATYSENLFKVEHRETAEAYYNIAFVCDKQGNYIQALEWYIKALDVFKKVLGEEHPSTATTYNDIASVYYNQGDYVKALEVYQKALSLKENALSLKEKECRSIDISYAVTCNDIASIYIYEDYSEALKWFKKALAIFENVLGNEHPFTATTYNNIANIYNSQEDYSKALAWFKKALSIRENKNVFGERHPDTAASYASIASVYNNQGDYAKALEMYDKALTIFEAVFGKEHPDTASIYYSIASVYDNQGDYARALELYQNALVINENVFGLEHPYTTIICKNIAGIYYNQGDYTKAQEWDQKAFSY